MPAAIAADTSTTPARRTRRRKEAEYMMQMIAAEYADGESQQGADRSRRNPLLRLDFPGFTGEDTLEHISWEQWFNGFDRNRLALIVQDTTADGQRSNFNELVSRDTVEE